MQVTTAVFLDRFLKVHGNTYDYSRFVYSGRGHEPVTIICKTHGAFTQSPYNHAAGHGCKACKDEARGKAKRVSSSHRADLLEARSPHLDFSELRNSDWTPHTAIPVSCPTHGRFIATYSNLLRGKGCPTCGSARRGVYTGDHEIAPQRKVADARMAKAGPLFVQQASEVHAGKYIYDVTAYKGMRKHMTIQCPVHGGFSQSPMKHLAGQGCPACSHHMSKGEIEIAEFLQTLGVSVLRRVRDIIPPLELDIYLPDQKVAVEYNGTYWHAEEPTRHRKKYDLCASVGIRLIQIFDDEWQHRQRVVKDLLTAVLGQRSSMGARSTEVVELSSTEARKFFDTHHISGYTPSQHKYGLRTDKGIVAAITLSKPRFEKLYDLEIVRFASSCNVRGGLEKLLSHVKSVLAPDSIVTYADLRFGTGASYDRAGFTYDSTTPPDYWWWKQGSPRIARYRTQRHKLQNHPEFSPFVTEGATEAEICKAAGYVKVYGVGHKKYIWRNDGL